MQIKFKINGQNWRIKTVNSDEMREQRADGDFAGLCVAAERMIFIDNDNVDYDTVCHELYHSYFSYLHLDDTQELTTGDYEEITVGEYMDNGNMGCTASHRGVLELICHHRWQRTLILEDDFMIVVPPDEFHDGELGWLVALGDTPKEVLDRIKALADLLPDGLNADVEALAGVIKEIDTAKDEGIPFTDQTVPEPATVLE